MRRLLVFVTVALSALAVPATSSAQRAVHLQDAVDISDSFESPLLSGACGFPVTVTVTGALDVTLIYNRAGLVVRQIETLPRRRRLSARPRLIQLPGGLDFPLHLPRRRDVGLDSELHVLGAVAVRSCARVRSVQRRHRHRRERGCCRLFAGGHPDGRLHRVDGRHQPWQPQQRRGDLHRDLRCARPGLTRRGRPGLPR